MSRAISQNNYDGLEFGPTIKQIVLEKLSRRYSFKIPRHLIENMTIEQQVDLISDSICVGIGTFLSSSHWTENINESTKDSFEYVPLTWWDAFKLRYKFMVNTVEYRKIKVKSINSIANNNFWIYPHIPPNVNKEITNFVIAYTEYQKE